MHIITALFNHRADAEAAMDQLVQDLHIALDAITRHDADEDATVDGAAPVGEQGFWTLLKDLFAPGEEPPIRSESQRHGHVMISVEVDEASRAPAMELLKLAGAVDLHERSLDDEAFDGAPADTRQAFRPIAGQGDAGAVGPRGGGTDPAIADIPGLGATDLGLTDLGVRPAPVMQPSQTPPGRAAMAPPWA